MCFGREIRKKKFSTCTLIWRPDKMHKTFKFYPYFKKSVDPDFKNDADCICGHFKTNSM